MMVPTQTGRMEIAAMTTISSAAGALAAYTSYYAAHSGTMTPNADTAKSAQVTGSMGNAAATLVADTNASASLSALLGTGTGSASTLSTLLSLAGNSNGDTGLLATILGANAPPGTSNGSATGDLLADITGQTGGTSAGSSLLEAVDGRRGASSGTTATNTTQQQMILGALAGAYSQSQQNLFTLLA